MYIHSQNEVLLVFTKKKELQGHFLWKILNVRFYDIDVFFIWQLLCVVYYVL